MAINFPNSPQLDDTYTEGNRSWRWNGRFWQATSATVGYTGSQGDQGESFRILGSVATVNDLPADSSGLPGDGYIIIDTGDLYIWDGSNWNNNGRIVGYTGSRGATGASVKLLGSVATEQDLPTDGTSDGSTLLVAGEAYIVQSSGNLFVWNGSEFTDVGKITGETGPIGYTGSQGDQGPIGYTGSSGGSSGGGGARYINLVMSGELTPPIAGQARFYPPESLTITKIYASISSQASGGDFTFRLNKNGVDTGVALLISSGSFTMTPVVTSIAVNAGDYLTLDLTGVGSRDLHVKMEYELVI